MQTETLEKTTAKIAPTNDDVGNSAQRIVQTCRKCFQLFTTNRKENGKLMTPTTSEEYSNFENYLTVS